MKYKLRGCIIGLFWLFTLLLQGQVVWAETDLLNLSAYQEASTPEYGENVLVAQDEKTGAKWLTVGKEEGSTGRLKFPVNLSGDFEVVVKVNPNEGQAFFLTADEYRIKVGFWRAGSVGLQAGSDTGPGDESKAWKGYSTNILKLSVSGNVAKLYVNDVFSQKLTLKADLTYTQLLYQGLDQNSQLYQVILGGSGGSAQPPVTGAQTDLLNLSAYQEATTPLYGENVLIGQDEKTEIKWLTVGKEAGSTGRLKFPVNLSDDFEVVVKVNPNEGQAFFLTADEYRIKVGFWRAGSVGLQAGSDTGPGDGSSAWMGYTTNTLKLSVSGNVAKLYVNDVFSQKLTLKAGLTYTQFLYQGLDQNSKLYQVTLGGSGGSGQPSVTGNQEPETDLLNLSTYQEATTPSYGENVLVGQDDQADIKWLTVGKEAGSVGRLKFPVNLSGDFEVAVKVNPNEGQAFFITADEYRIKVGFWRAGSVGLQAGSDTGPGDGSSAWMGYTTNTLKLSISGNVVKLYVNDVFSQKLTLKSSLTYTQLLYDGLDQNSKLYKLKVGQGVTVNPTPNPTPTTPTTPTTPKPAKTCGCKKLSPPVAVDATGKSVTTATVTYAGIIVNNQPPVVEVKQKLFDTVEVLGDLEVDPVDVGQQVDIFVYAAATFPGVSTVSYYMLGPGLNIMAWDQHPASLVAFSSGTLGVFQTVQMYSGKFYYPGTLKVYFGYRLPNGVVITSSVPIDITIEQ